MSQPISVVVPVYEGVTQLDFTGPHQFLSRTPDLHVRVASLGGEPVTADRLTFSNLDDLAAIESCDVLLVPGGGGCSSLRSRMTSSSRDTRPAGNHPALSDFGVHRVAHFGRCRLVPRPPCGLPLGMAGVASCLRCHRG